MAGVKGKSGPPGNYNSAKWIWDVYLRRRALSQKDGELREEDAWLRTVMEKYRSGLFADKPDATAGERRAMELAAEAFTCRLLIWDAVGASGFTRQTDEGLALMPAAEALPKFIGAELGALKLLGLERRAKAVDVYDYAKRRYGSAGDEDAAATEAPHG